MTISHSLRWRVLGLVAVLTAAATALSIAPSGASAAWPVDTAPISYGYRHGLAVRFDGAVLAWGNNHYGQLGLPVGVAPSEQAVDTDRVDIPPTPVSGATNVVSVAAGHDFSLALTADGRVWAWGRNDQGQLGLGYTSLSVSTPQRVPGLGGIMAIAAGPDHALVVASDGRVWTWGDNDSGQLGIGAGLGDQVSPVTVPGLPTVLTVAAGGYQYNWTDGGDSHSLAVDKNGNVWGWGWNWSGQVGDGTTTTRLSPVKLTGISDARSVAAGIDHSLAVKADGTVWAWGQNTGGDLGDGTSTRRLQPVKAKNLTDARQIAAGRYSSYAVQGDGSVWRWGKGVTGDSFVDVKSPQRTGVVAATAVTAADGIWSEEGLAFAVRTDGSGWTMLVAGLVDAAAPVPGLHGLSKPRPAPCSGAESSATVTIDEAIAGYATGVGIAVIDQLVTTVNQLGKPVREARATLDVSLRGEPPEQFSLVLPAESNPDDGLPPLREGSPYLVYLKPMHDPGLYAHPPMGLAYDRPGGSLGIVPAGETTTCEEPPPPNYVTTTTTTTAPPTTTTVPGPPPPPPVPEPPVTNEVTTSGCRAPRFGRAGFNSLTTTPSTLRWTYFISNAVPANFRDNVQAAMDKWSAANSGFTAVYGGMTSSNAFDPNDGTAIVSWSDLSEGTSTEGYPAGQGRTDNGFHPGDIVINSDPRFADNSQATWADSRPANAEAARTSLDIERTLVHEAGHVIGLDHQADTTSVMCGTGPTWSGDPPRNVGHGEQAGVRNQRPGGIVEGYYMLTGQGHVVVVGGQGSTTPSAQFYGDMQGHTLNRPAIDLTITPSRRGYWMLAADGGIFTFGDAGFFGSTGDMQLNKPVVGMATTPSGNGYWLVAADGGIFTFGDAQFHGSMGGTHLNQPVVGMAATPSGNGYWLVAADGGIFSFGDAPFHGSMGGTRLNQPVVGIAGTPNGGGYWMVAADGGIFTFGNAAYSGSSPRDPADARNISPVPGSYSQYAVARGGGAVDTFGFPYLGHLGNDGSNDTLAAVEVVRR